MYIWRALAWHHTLYHWNMLSSSHDGRKIHSTWADLRDVCAILLLYFVVYRIYEEKKKLLRV